MTNTINAGANTVELVATARRQQLAALDALTADLPTRAHELADRLDQLVGTVDHTPPPTTELASGVVDDCDPGVLGVRIVALGDHRIDAVHVGRPRQPVAWAVLDLWGWAVMTHRKDKVRTVTRVDGVRRPHVPGRVAAALLRVVAGART